MKNKIDLNKMGKIFFLFWIASNFILVGSTMNFIVMKNNNGKMPVPMKAYYSIKYPPSNLEDYVLFRDKKEVNYHYLSDMIPFLFIDGYMSIGDLLMFIGLGGTIFATFLFKIKTRRIRNEIKS